MTTTLLGIVLAIISTFMGAIGSIVFKISSKQITFSFGKLLRNKTLLLGFFLFGATSIIYIFALRFGELTVLYPITSLTYVWSTILAKIYLKEKINVYKWTGILLIVLASIIMVQ